MQSASYEATAEQFTTELMREYYVVGSGQKESLELASIYEKYRDLFAPSVVRERIAAVDDKENLYLADFATQGYLENRVKQLSEAITNAELSATVWWDDQPVPYQQVPIQIRNEPDLARRHALAERYHAVVAQDNPRRAERWNVLHEEAQALGFENYVDLCERLRRLNLKNFAAQLLTLLDQSEASFEMQLSARLSEIGVPREQATSADVAHLSRAKEFDSFFRDEDMLTALTRTLNGLGLELGSSGALKLDLETRPLKSPRAFCAPIVVPSEVMLVIKPHGGQDDYHALFHEAGHAEHYVHVDPSMPFAYRYLGDNSVTESFAFLFEHLHHSRRWLQEVVGMNAADAERYMQFSLFHKLWLMRRYAAKLHYELELHQGRVEDYAERYVYWLHRAGRVHIPRARYLSDVDDAFYAAQYLRAWIFEMQLRDYLQRTFGEDWYHNKRAGHFLKELWSIGQRDHVEDLAERIGADRLDLELLMAEVNS